jgi:hypothetical protein
LKDGIPFQGLWNGKKQQSWHKEQTMSNPTSNFNWQMPTNSDLVTDLPADFEVFGQAVDTSMADLKGGTTGQILSKATNTDMDFVWIANDQGDITGITATSPLTGGGTSGAVTVGIQSATTSQAGAVQLTDSTSTTSSTLAATATAVKSAYDKASTAATTSVAGIVQLSDSTSTTSSVLASTPTATKAAYDLANRPNPSNPILNSAMQVWQRGTSISTSSANTYTADRWATSAAGSASTISRQSTNDTTNLPFIQYCMRFQRNSGQTNTTTYGIYQAFETANTIPFVGKTITLSFYARAGANYSPTSSLIGVQLFAGTGTDQNPYSGGYTGQTIPINTTQAITTTWARYTQTVSLGATITEITPSFYMSPTGTAGANDYFEITGVQIDIGSVALPFRTYAATIQGELAACQRYYWRASGSQGVNSTIGTAQASSTTGGRGYVTFPVTMRVAPTSVDYSAIAMNEISAAYTATSLTLVGSGLENPNTAAIQIGTASGLTQYRFYAITINNSASGYLGFSAEL